MNLEWLSRMNLELLSALLAGGSLIVSITVLFVGWRILRRTRRTEQAGDERLEILREQQERLKVMYEERSILQEELERLHSAINEGKRRPLELPTPAEPERPQERRGYWSTVFGR
jgi:Tfp pilus assembly protein PilN